MTKSSWKRLQRVDQYAAGLCMDEDERYSDRIEGILKRHTIDTDRIPGSDMVIHDWAEGTIEVYNRGGGLMLRVEAIHMVQ